MVSVTEMKKILQNIFPITKATKRNLQNQNKEKICNTECRRNKIAKRMLGRPQSKHQEMWFESHCQIGARANAPEFYREPTLGFLLQIKEGLCTNGYQANSFKLSHVCRKKKIIHSSPCCSNGITDSRQENTLRSGQINAHARRLNINHCYQEMHQSPPQKNNMQERQTQQRNTHARTQ